MQVREKSNAHVQYMPSISGDKGIRDREQHRGDIATCLLHAIATCLLDAIATCLLYAVFIQRQLCRLYLAIGH